VAKIFAKVGKNELESNRKEAGGEGDDQIWQFKGGWVTGRRDDNLKTTN